MAPHEETKLRNSIVRLNFINWAQLAGLLTVIYMLFQMSGKVYSVVTVAVETPKQVQQTKLDVIQLRKDVDTLTFRFKEYKGLYLVKTP